MPGWLAVLLGIGVSALLGVVLYLLVFDPVRNKRELLGPAIGSQAFGLILGSVAAWAAGGYSMQFPPLLKLPELRIGAVQISGVQIAVLIIALIAMLGFHGVVQ